MTTLANQPTRKQIGDAVITILQQLGGSTNDRDGLFTQVFEYLNFDPHLMGIEEKSGRLRAGKSFNAVCFHLKKAGRILQPVRGTYSLPQQKTPVVQTPQSNVVNIPQPQNPQVQTPQVLVNHLPQPKVTPQVQMQPETRQKIVVDKTIGTSLNLPQIADWDNYLVGLATQNSACFGTKYNTRSAVCKGCPMANHCQAKRGALLADLARDLESAVLNGTITQLFNTDTDEAPEPKVEAAPKVEAQSPEATTLNQGDFYINIDVEGIICESCGGVIAKGSKAVCVPGKGTFHKECV